LKTLLASAEGRRHTYLYMRSSTCPTQTQKVVCWQWWYWRWWSGMCEL